jgi:hypothetical protein
MSEAQSNVIEIVLMGGLVESVKAPKGTTVKVYDYDVDGTTMPVQHDPEGDEFIEFTHEGLGDWD